MDIIGILVDIMKKHRLLTNWVSKDELNDCVKISRIDGCNIKRVGNLEFDFSFGACNTYQFNVEKILFCFGFFSSHRQCHL